MCNNNNINNDDAPPRAAPMWLPARLRCVSTALPRSALARAQPPSGPTAESLRSRRKSDMLLLSASASAPAPSSRSGLPARLRLYRLLAPPSTAAIAPAP